MCGVGGQAGSPGNLRSGEGFILTRLTRKSRTAFTVSIQRRPIRPMAGTTRVSSAVSLEFSACQPARLLLPMLPETPPSR